MKRLATLLLLCAVVAGCGSNSTPTAPSIPSADLRLSGQGSWTSCFFGDCLFSASIQNLASGCASGTTVIARFYDGNNQQVGSDTQMGAVGSGLSGRTIRPQEIVALASVGIVGATTISRTQSYRLFPTWNDVRCP